MSSVLSPVSLYELQPSTGSAGQLNGSTGASAPKPTAATAPAAQGDTVKLSVTQQVRNLHSEGEGPGQIASSLGLTSSQVNGDLYVSLTWPQLLSKVASSTLNLGGSSSDASTSGVSDASVAVALPAGTSEAASAGVRASGAGKPEGAASAPGAAKPEAAGYSDAAVAAKDQAA